MKKARGCVRQPLPTPKNKRVVKQTLLIVT
jgi:hypothetical protein